MSKLVVILGAGASKGMGLPLLGQMFEDQMVRDYLQGEAVDLLNFLQEHIWGIRGYNLDTASLTLNIEEILTQLKDWIREPSTAPINESDILRFQKMLLGCVYKAVYPSKGHGEERYLNQLALGADRGWDEVTWASFNWDAKFEQAFYHAMKSDGQEHVLPTCIPELRDYTGNNPKHLLLKLHGSVNWFRHEDKSVHYLRFGTKFKSTQPVDEWWTKYLEGRTSAEPLIVEPSFYKHEVTHDSGSFVGKMWTEFNQKLAFAEDILVCGYSLPDGDAHAKSSIITAVTNNPGARWIVVDPGQQTLDKYSRLLGKARIKCEKCTLLEYVAENYAT